MHLVRIARLAMPKCFSIQSAGVHRFSTMPPLIATIVVAAFILFLFRAELKRNFTESKALWVPFAWMFLAGSRYVSQWLDLGPPLDSPDVYLDGSPIDRWIFTILIAAGIFILTRRRIALGEVILANKWIVLFFVFGFISILWSDYPFVSFKRWIKASGTLIMALVILTERHPYRALGVLLKRLSFLLVPLSILAIKYYPEIGRSYNRWTYEPMFNGIANTKNGLGAICLYCGLYYLWSTFNGRTRGIESVQWSPLLLNGLFLGMIAWLLYMANSATALLTLALVGSLLIVGKLPTFKKQPRRLFVACLATLLLFAVFELATNLSEAVFGLVGRDATLTTRVPMWAGLREMVPNPLLGAGFESFWLGPRLYQTWEMFGTISQAHNGYLETYLNLGIIGLGLIVGILLSGMAKVYARLEYADPEDLLRLALITAAIFYNWTEAAFHGVNNMWLLTLVSVLSVSGLKKAAAQPAGKLQHAPSSEFRSRNAVAGTSILFGPRESRRVRLSGINKTSEEQERVFSRDDFDAL